jgi:hypothetical protein
MGKRGTSQTWDDVSLPPDPSPLSPERQRSRFILREMCGTTGGDFAYYCGYLDGWEGRTSSNRLETNQEEYELGYQDGLGDSDVRPAWAP